jgi:hypothetical protein
MPPPIWAEEGGGGRGRSRRRPIWAVAGILKAGSPKQKRESCAPELRARICRRLHRVKGEGGREVTSSLEHNDARTRRRKGPSSLGEREMEQGGGEGWSGAAAGQT